MRIQHAAALLLAITAALGTGPVRANTVSAAADPLPNQTLTITTVAATTTSTTQSHPRGSLVRLQAAPSPGHRFLGWSGACSGTATSCNVLLGTDRSVTARFGPVLTVAVSGGGRVDSSPAGIGCGADCSEAYAYGSSITLSATPNAGRAFGAWGGACSGTAPTCTVTMSAAQQVSASFVAAPVVQLHPLNVTVAGGGSVGSAPAGISCGSDCSESYAAGTTVSLTATPAAGQQFSGWSGACSGTGACSVAMTQARSVGASFAALPGSGPVLYFSDCQADAQTGCVPGDNAQAGTSPLAPKRTLAGIDVNALPAGTQLLFARGGVWTGTGWILRNMNATADRPLVFGSYSAPWGGTARPWLKVGSLGSVFVFGWYNETENDGGYTLRGLKLDGLGGNGAGLFIGNNVHHVLLEDLEVTRFRIGLESQQNGQQPTQYTLRQSLIHGNSAMGLLGSGEDLVIEHNRFEANNFSGSGFNHGVYLGGHGRNGVVRHNRFVRNSVVNGRCTGGNLTVHGQWDGLLIEHNSIEQDASDLGCYGISINSAYDTPEYFRNLVVRNNRILNLGACGVCLTSAPGAIVENNLIVNTQSSYHAGILIPDRTPGPGDDLDGGAIIRNNTIVLTRAAAMNEAIALRANAGGGIQVVSNLIYYGAASNAQHHCFSHQARSQYAAFDHNLCHHAGGSGTWSATHATPGAAAAAGFDVHGLAVDPLFVALPSTANDWLDQIQAVSPARGAGHPTLSSASDRVGVPRTTPSIGAREPASSAVVGR